MTTGLLGGIEAGGSKFVCAIGTPDGELTDEVRFPTTTPAETLSRAVAFFERQKKVDALGVGSFGPVDLNTRSRFFGFVTATPKPGWSGTDVVGLLRQALGVPIVFDTDVNAAALGEHRWGAARGLNDFVYVTVGTGIGGGVVAGGQAVHGLVHPEIGHMLVPHDPEHDPFEGSCPFHGDCLEGLASGPAIAKRWGQPAIELPSDHPAWELEAEYLAAMVVNLTLVLSPRRILLGGGVMERRELFPAIRSRVQERLRGYIDATELGDGIDAYLMAPELGNRAGILGALALGAQAQSSPRPYG
jgi:fructokinase